MKKIKRPSEFQPSIALFLTLNVIVQVILYLFIYQFQEFSMSMFFLMLLIPIGGFCGFFFGAIPSIVYSVAVIVAIAVLAVFQPAIISTFLYLTVAMTILTTTISAYAHRAYQLEHKKLKRLQQLQNNFQVVDPVTKLETGQVIAELLVKQSYLAHRYPDYTFTVAMVRLDFIQTAKNLLGKKDFYDLLGQISDLLQAEIRVEDYKFSASEGVFLLVLPLTKQAAFEAIEQRIKGKILEIELLDRNRKIFIPTIRTGAIMYEDTNFDTFQNMELLLLQLQRKTEVDIVAEY